MGISIWQLLIILVIVVLLFGTKKLRNMGGDLGSAIKNFKSSMGEGEAETRSGGDKKDNGKLIEQEPEDVETQKKQNKDSSRNE